MNKQQPTHNAHDKTNDDRQNEKSKQQEKHYQPDKTRYAKEYSVRGPRGESYAAGEVYNDRDRPRGRYGSRHQPHPVEDNATENAENAENAERLKSGQPQDKNKRESDERTLKKSDEQRMRDMSDDDYQADYEKRKERFYGLRGTPADQNPLRPDEKEDEPKP